MTGGRCPIHDDMPTLLREGYLFATQRREQEGIDPASDRPLRLRLLGKPALLVRGAEGVRLFYDNDRIKRKDAMPKLISGSLFGNGSVHGLDDAAHRHRKATFVGGG